MTTETSLYPSPEIRVAVYGTGHWADLIHLPSLASMKEVRLVGVMGRDSAKVAALAEKYAITAFRNFEEMLDAVDAVAFAAPPDVQLPLAIRAARNGKHLILEKPIALTFPDARQLSHVISESGVVSIVFLARLFVDQVRAAIERAVAAEIRKATVIFRCGSLLPGSPYASSAWRQSDYGVLWDVGPHALSVILSVMGPVQSASGTMIREGCFRCELIHIDNRSSEMILDMKDETIAGVEDRYIFTGDDVTITLDDVQYDRRETYKKYVISLLDGVKKKKSPYQPTLNIALDIVSILCAVQLSVESGGSFVDIITH